MAVAACPAGCRVMGCTALLLCAATMACLLRPSRGGSAVAATVCQLKVQGRDSSDPAFDSSLPGAGRIAHASLSCSGTPAVMAVNRTVLGPFRATFQGVVWAADEAACNRRPPAARDHDDLAAHYCLLSLCGNTHAVFVNSSITGVDLDVYFQGDAAVGLCAADNSKLTWSSSHIVNNSGAALMAMHAAQVIVTDGSTISYNRQRGLIAADNSRVVITGRSTISRNTIAVSSVSGTPGGGLLATGQSQVLISEASMFYRNSAFTGGGAAARDNTTVTITSGSTFINNTSDWDGGGLAADGNASVLISNGVVFAGNHASQIGGGASATDNATMTIASSSFTNNTSDWDGGALGAAGGVTVIIRNSTVTHNTAASSGGGLRANSGRRIIITDGSSFSFNSALQYDGGGLAAARNVPIEISGSSSFVSNTAWNSSGGGVAVTSQATVTITGSSSFINNTSINYSGGGLYATRSASVLITGNSRFVGNTAKGSSGGGVSAAGKSRVTIAGGSAFFNNTCTDYSGAGLAASGNSQVLVTGGSTFSGNSAVNGSGGGLAAFGNTSVTVSGSSRFRNNTSSQFAGGGLSVQNMAELLLSEGSAVEYNVAVNASGGGLLAGESALVNITNSSVVNNLAKDAGGGISVEGDAAVTIGNGSSVSGNVAQGGRGEDLSWLQGGKGGGLAVRDNGRVFVLGGSTFENNTSSGDGGAMWANGSSTVVIRSSTVRRNTATVQGGGLHAEDVANISITDGSVFDGNVAARGRDVDAFANNTLSLQGSNLHLHSDGVLWTRVDCVLGEVLQVWCAECRAPLFSLDPGFKGCSVCPANAECPGGAVIAPRLGYWHSSPRSTQMHRCLGHRACAAGGVCSEGYSGHLCASCAEGYSLQSLFQCSRCLPRATVLGLYLAAAVVLLGFITYTVSATYHDNQQDQLQPVYACDLLKVVILHVQYLAIISAVQLQWPKSASALFAAANWVLAATSSQVLSLDCLLTRGAAVPVAMQRLLLYLLAPLCMVVGVLLVKGLWRALMRLLLLLLGRCPRFRQQMARLRGSGGSRRGATAAAVSTLEVAGGHRAVALGLVEQLPVILLVVMFVFYPSVVRVAWSMFACYHIDRSDGGANDPYPQYAIANAPHGYWVQDMQQACWQGWHTRWGLALGIPCLLAFCLGVPALLVWWLVKNRSRLADAGFRIHYGFLYRDYRAKRCYWGAVQAVQTVLLVCVSVFTYTVGVYYSTLLLNLLLGLGLVLQLLAKPYRSQILHRIQLASSGCLFLTTYTALSLLSLDRENGWVYPQVVGAVALLLNAAFLVWSFYYCVAVVARGTLAAVLAAAGRLAGKVCGKVCGCSTHGRTPSHRSGRGAGGGNKNRQLELLPGGGVGAVPAAESP